MVSCQQRGVGQSAKATQGQGGLWVSQARAWCQLGLGLQHHGQRLSHCQNATVMGQQRPPPAMLIQPVAPPMIPLPIWHWIFLQMTRRGLFQGAPVAHGRAGMEPNFPQFKLQLGRPLPRLPLQGCPQVPPAASPHFFFFLSSWFSFLFLKLLCMFPFHSRVIIFGQMTRPTQTGAFPSAAPPPRVRS